MVDSIPSDTTVDKRSFLAALVCPTQAWLARRAPAAAVTPAVQWAFWCGNRVGEAARAQLGAGLMLPRTPAPLARETTRRMIEEPASTLLFEASFHAGTMVARADAIRRSGDTWDVIEVKSGKEPADGKAVDQAYLDDLAFTVMVARAAGVAIGRCTLMLLSRSYRLGVPGDLLVDLDVTEPVLERAREFEALAPSIGAVLTGAQRPEPTLKLACRSCDFFATECLGKGIEASIFMLPGLSAKRLAVIAPEVDLQRLPAATDLTDNQRRVFDVMRTRTALVMPGLTRLDEVTWPACYLDFETVSPVLPWFDGDAAREQHTFQYSVHVSEKMGQVTVHHEYLAHREGDWRRELTERLLEALGERGSIVVYTNFEQQRLEDLAVLFPDLASRIQLVIGRLFDLNDVVKRGYCHPGFKGSTSIKKVLPVMAPELGYDGMVIGEGLAASGTFGLMRVGELALDAVAGWRKHLLAYCKLDTLAMVKVHESLDQVRRAS